MSYQQGGRAAQSSHVTASEVASSSSILKSIFDEVALKCAGCGAGWEAADKAYAVFADYMQTQNMPAMEERAFRGIWRNLFTGTGGAIGAVVIFLFLESAKGNLQTDMGATFKSAGQLAYCVFIVAFLWNFIADGASYLGDLAGSGYLSILFAFSLFNAITGPLFQLAGRVTQTQWRTWPISYQVANADWLFFLVGPLMQLMGYDPDALDSESIAVAVGLSAGLCFAGAQLFNGAYRGTVYSIGTYFGAVFRGDAVTGSIQTDILGPDNEEDYDSDDSKEILCYSKQNESV